MMSLRQRDGMLAENWYIACLSHELGIKKPIQRIIYDEPLVLFRTKEGAVACLPDRCLHRHAQLSQGDVFDGKIGCPYHGWTYNAEGLVVDIPSEGNRFCIDQGKRLKAYPVVEQDNCIWVWMGNGRPTSERPPFRFPNFNDKKWSHYFMITDFDNEVTHLAENFVDVPHTVFVHKGWFRTQASKQVPIKVTVASGQVLTTYDQPSDSIGFTKRILNPRNEPMVHTDCFILPNITKVDYYFGSKFGFVIISQITPVSTLKSRVYTAIIFKVPRFKWLFYLFFRYYTRVVITQDVEIMANQGASFRRDMSENFMSTDADIIHQNVEKLRAWASDGDPQAFTYSSQEEKVIWI